METWDLVVKCKSLNFKQSYKNADALLFMGTNAFLFFLTVSKHILPNYCFLSWTKINHFITVTHHFVLNSLVDL